MEQKDLVQEIAVKAYKDRSSANCFLLLKEFDELNEETLRVPGIIKIKGDLLFSCEKYEEALECYKKDDQAGFLDALIVRLFDCAITNYKIGHLESAKQNLKTAIDACFEFNSFSFSSGYFWAFDFVSYYEYHQQIIDACSLIAASSHSTDIEIGEVYRWKAEFLIWAQANFDDFDKITNTFEDESLKKILFHIDHPSLLGIRSALFSINGDFINSLNLHIQFAKWKINQSKGIINQHTVNQHLRVNEEASRTKTNTRKVYQLILKELRETKNPKEIELIFGTFYTYYLGGMLGKHDLNDEMKVITGLLIESLPNDKSILWDYAFIHHSGIMIGDSQKAEAGWRQLISIDPENASALHNLSIILQKHGNLTEAANLSIEAYKYNPESKNISNRFEWAKKFIEEQSKLVTKQETLKKLNEVRSEKKIKHDQLSLKQKLYISTLLRCCLTEDNSKITSINSSPMKVSPLEQLTRKIVRDLWNENLILVSPNSTSSSYGFDEKGRLEIELLNVEWLINVKKPEEMSLTNFLTFLIDPEEITDDQFEEATYLWKEVSLYESLEYLQHERARVNLLADIGEKTEESFTELLKYFSTGQICSIIYSVVPRALADYEAGKVQYRTQASNLIPGRCKSYGEKAYAERWQLRISRRNFECEQSTVSETLFNKILRVGQAGFDKKPGSFTNTLREEETTASI